ncbi:MAG: cytochrome c [Bradymonadaceae bacterium]
MNRPLNHLFRGLVVLSWAALCLGCDSEVETPPTTSAEAGEFPGSPDLGKTDVFGRSLVGAADPYRPNSELISDPTRSEAVLAGNMLARRELGWEVAYKVLEPVPLLGLANQIGARPACPEGVVGRDLDRCARQGEAECTTFESNGVDGICSFDETSAACQPACDHLTLADGQEIPRIPRWQTWYGVEDLNRTFQYAYGSLSPEDKVGRAPFSDELIGAAIQFNNTQVDRSSRWPLSRYTDAAMKLFGCSLEQRDGEPDEDFDARCASARQSQFSGAAPAGGGVATLMYSPAMVLHLMRNYGEVLECKDKLLSDTWCDDGPCDEPEDNFSTCFKAEFPADAGHPWAGTDDPDSDAAGLPPAGGTVIMKATWARVGFGFDLPAYDTDAEALQRRLEQGARALWEPDGDRLHAAPQGSDPGYPGFDDIYTIKTASGALYRLTGLHAMTKELRHWVWVSLWWSDEPDVDFGEDRPESFERLPGVWSNYKMCVVVDYMEKDGRVLDRFTDFPTLQAALAATEPVAGAPTWCSNPYIEHEAGNARTNCIGCHQHAGTSYDEGMDGQYMAFNLTEVIADESPVLSPLNRYPANGRTKRRNMFATDYAWAFSRLDDLTELLRTEVEFGGAQDENWVRINDILKASGDQSRGETIFSSTTPEQTCANCHGDQGEGGRGPAFEQLFSQKTDWQMMHTIIHGRGDMPAWGERLTNEDLRDLFTYLRATHGQN